MTRGDLIGFSVTALVRHRRRSLLSVLGMTVGVAAVVMLTALGEGARLGASRIEVEAMPGFALEEDSTLGEEFAIDGAPSGFFEDGEVAMLYAGTQCFFR